MIGMVAGPATPASVLLEGLQKHVSGRREPVRERPYVSRHLDSTSAGIGRNSRTEFISFSNTYKLCTSLCIQFFFGKEPKIKSIHWLLNYNPVQLFPVFLSLFRVDIKSFRPSGLWLFRFTNCREYRKSF